MPDRMLCSIAEPYISHYMSRLYGRKDCMFSSKGSEIEAEACTAIAELAAVGQPQRSGAASWTADGQNLV